MRRVLKSRVLLYLPALLVAGLALFVDGCSTDDSPSAPIASADKAKPENPGPPNAKDSIVYEQDFERLRELDSAALSDDGWQVFGNAFDVNGVLMYNYGPYPAPNHEFAFCNVVVEGERKTTEKWLNVFGDYNNTFVDGFGNRVDHVEGLVFQEYVISVDDIGKEVTFALDAEKANLEGMSTAMAFIKTLDPNANYQQTNLVAEDMTDAAATWEPYAISLSLAAPELVGQILQFGFSATIYNPDYNEDLQFDGSGIYYDNLMSSKE